MAKIKEGLIDPLQIPPEDILPYMATTYTGYMTEIQQRLYVVTQFMHISNVSRDFIGDFIFLQARCCCELFAFALSCYQQSQIGPIGKNKRTENDPSKIVSSIQDCTIWIKPAAKTNSEAFVIHDSSSMCHNFANPDELHRFNGQLGDKLHVKQRPRPDKEGTLTVEEVYTTLQQFKRSIDIHFIGGIDGSGWIVETYKEFRAPVGGLDNLIKIQKAVRDNSN